MLFLYCYGIHKYKKASIKFMNKNELNEYIKKYVEDINCYGAIMITGGWGTGKSYFLRNELIPYLKKNTKCSILVVSLHGLRSEFDISKSIYFEYIFEKKIFKNAKKKIRSHSATLGLVGAKTIIKGVASYFNVNIDTSEKELEKVYKSIDLKNTLVVFEDVERSNINPVDIMAYVNNLVEYDGVKVLLVANESEMCGENSEKYKQIKEKTISDTIPFYSDYDCAIASILQKFENQKIGIIVLSKKKDEIVRTLVDQLKNVNKQSNINLRSVLYSFIKVNDLLDYYQDDLDFNFVVSILISSAVFVQKLKGGEKCVWNDADSVSSSLGCYEYPLQKFCYDYIVYNSFDKQLIKSKESEFLKYIEDNLRESELNRKLSIIYSCYLHKEEDVIKTIDYVFDELKEDHIPLNLYYKIANYLIYIKYMIGYGDVIDECNQIMINRLSGLSPEELKKIEYYGGINLCSSEEVDEFTNFKKAVESAVMKNNLNLDLFSYKLVDLKDFCERTIKSKDKYILDRCFSKRIDNKKIVQLLKSCSSEQINDIRGVYLSIYSFSNIGEFFSGDIDSLTELKDLVSDLLNFDDFDKIQKRQIKFFVSNLNDIISKINSYNLHR